MRVFGLIGKSLKHSFSPDFFAEKFQRELIRDAEYSLFELERIQEISSLLDGEIDGLNVTIPYKKEVIPFLDELDPIADKIGSVNTIAFREGKTIGFNTDWIGFRDSLSPLLMESDKRALIIGSGGSAAAIQFTFDELGIEWRVVSRNPVNEQLSYQELPEVIRDFQVIVNTTPVGMHPNVDEAPDIPFEQLGPNHLIYDLIYNPVKTLLLKRAAERSCRVKNGLEMLKLQAEASWRIWNELD
jgi:shikimate dehydrogenase